MLFNFKKIFNRNIEVSCNGINYVVIVKKQSAKKALNPLADCYNVYKL